MQPLRFILSSIFCLAALAIILWVICPAFAGQPYTGKPQTSANSGQPELVLQLGHSDEFLAISSSSDGRYIITGGRDNVAILWEAETGNEVSRFVGHTDAVLAVAVSSDMGYVLTGSADKTARLWDLATGKERYRIADAAESVSALAFSPDGQTFVIAEQSSARLFNVASGKLLRAFVAPPQPKNPEPWAIAQPFLSVAFSPDGHYLLSGGSGTGWLWDVATAKEIRRFVAPRAYHTSVAYSADGRFVLTGVDGIVRLWDAATAKELRQFSGYTSKVTVAFTPDAKQVLVGGDGAVELWDAQSGKLARSFQERNSTVWQSFAASLNVSALSSDGRFVIVGAGSGAARVFETATGRAVSRLEGYSSFVYAARFSSDGRYIITGGGRLASRDSQVSDYSARLWDLESGKEAQRFTGHQSWIISATLSPDGVYLATIDDRGTAIIWNAESGQEMRRSQKEFIGNWPGTQTPINYSENIISATSFSADGKYVVKGIKNTATLMTRSLQKIRTFTGHKGDIISIAFSPDGRRLATASRDRTLRLWDAANGKEILQFKNAGMIANEINFSPDGLQLVAGCNDGIVRSWETATGKALLQLEGHRGQVMSVNFSPDGRRIVSGGLDSTTRVWDAVSANELCRLISFRDGTWVSVDREGRFDTNNLETIRGLHWRMADDPLRLLPLEIFMRDYYEPRLLARILAGEILKPVRGLGQLNRVQPAVKIVAIEQQKNDPSLATITVEVAKVSQTFGQNSRKPTRTTGVYDVRLFRNGQIVGELPGVNAPGKVPTKNDEPSDNLLVWRRETQIQMDARGKQLLKFSNIKLPRRADVNQLEFSAYAFNEDRVKSQTAKKLFVMPANLPAVKGRAYLITVGVNAYESSQWNLTFAANDACLMYSALAERLARTGDYAEVIAVPLISDYEIRDGKPVVTEKTATRANFKAVMDLLAGRKVAPELIKQIPGGDKLREARPEDLLIISYSSHGYADALGNFYFFVYDIGATGGKKMTGEIKRRCISSEELSRWLRDVDAGELVFVVDACYSAGAIEGQGFKPGPMGSRGLGQLAYDKGMKILTATQADDVALESNLLRQGLLTYALVQEGVAANAADVNADRRIMVDEWLQFGLKRVPNLYEGVKKGSVQKLPAQPLIPLCKPNAGQPSGAQRLERAPRIDSGANKKAGFQKPSLFDFARHRRMITLVRN
ncbi:MAG: hypothetical protein AB1757_07975 [Acidobacteriota bacterium]